MKTLWGRNTFFLILILNLATGVSSAQEEEPFWRKKPRVYEKILKQKRIVVSVQKQTHSPQKVYYRMVGAGLVSAPLVDVRKAMEQFEDLKKISSHFKKVVHNKKKQQLFLQVEAAGYETQLTMDYKWKESTKGLEQMDWRVTQGTFTGMQGHYKLISLDEFRTEVSTWTLLPEPKVPIPSFLLNFTLEVIAEKIAQKMRSYIEKNSQKMRTHESK